MVRAFAHVDTFTSFGAEFAMVLVKDVNRAEHDVLMCERRALARDALVAGMLVAICWRAVVLHGEIADCMLPKRDWRVCVSELSRDGIFHGAEKSFGHAILMVRIWRGKLLGNALRFAIGCYGARSVDPLIVGAQDANARTGHKRLQVLLVELEVLLPVSLTPADVQLYIAGHIVDERLNVIFGYGARCDIWPPPVGVGEPMQAILARVVRCGSSPWAMRELAGVAAAASVRWLGEPLDSGRASAALGNVAKMRVCDVIVA